MSRLTIRANSAIDSLLYGFATYGVPVAIGLVSLVALVAWDSEHASDGGTGIRFRYLEDTARALTPAQALAQLETRSPVRYQDTKLSESPFWFVFEVPGVEGEETQVELPSRHAVGAACWDATNLRALGDADRQGSSGQMKAVKAGFAVDLGGLKTGAMLLCRGTFAGPARMTVVRWTASQLDLSIKKFHRESGLLDGGLIVLSLFVLLTAIISREWLYMLFAVWLVANLRVAALSAGWDTQWLGRTVPLEWVLSMRQAAMAGYYVLTITLFGRLFRNELPRVGYAVLLHIARWLCVAILIAAAVLPYSKFLPVFWVLASYPVVVMVFFMARILFITRSKVAMWYSASLGLALSANLYEVISAALGLKIFIGTINSVTAALSSSLLTALAIAEQMRQERQEKVRAQAELKTTYEAIPIGLFTLDESGAFMRVNPALRDMLRVHSEPGRRNCWGDYFEPGAWDRLREIASGELGQEIEIRGVGRDPRWFLVKATLSQDKIEGSLQDITERTKATDRLRFLAENDPLTGVLNRRGIEKVLAETIARLDNGKPLAVAYLDLDRFKLINDLFGHLAGDEVLKQLCIRVKETMRVHHAMGRVGGDEFVIVFQDTPIQAAAEVCRAIVERIGMYPYQIGDRAFQVKGSIGLIEVAGGIKVKDAISAADRACRAAKGGHHDGLVVYEKNASLFREREEELHLIERFGVGVAPEGLFLLMQPIMSLRAPYDSLNFEVLLRMREADNTITPAGKIISAAENNGRIAVIDKWVLSNTLEWIDAHYDELKRTQFVCVNLSGASLNDERFIQDAFAILGEHGRTVERLCVEITESVALHDMDNTRRFIDRARTVGAGQALDDFGAGYTSFSYLKELAADAVKIDGSFVRDVNRHPANLAIVEAIADLAGNLGMKTIAEWAEDCDTVESLANIGIDYVQGWAIAMPQDPAKILVAHSAASFIEDEKVSLFVRDSLASVQAIELWDQFGGYVARS